MAFAVSEILWLDSRVVRSGIGKDAEDTMLTQIRQQQGLSLLSVLLFLVESPSRLAFSVSCLALHVPASNEREISTQACVLHGVRTS